MDAEQARRDAIPICEVDGHVVTHGEIVSGYAYKLHNVRGRVRGRDETMRRFLETALDAAQADVPCLPVILERLEDVLKMLSKEIQ